MSYSDPPPRLPPGFTVERGAWYLIVAYTHTADGRVFLSQWGCRRCGAFAFVPGPAGIMTPCFCHDAWPGQTPVHRDM